MTDLTIVIPTQGRATLDRCLRSMLPEHHGGYRAEVIVVADVHSPLLCDVAGSVRQYGMTYVEYDGGRHDWGYPQLGYGYSIAGGAYVLNQGDDDVYEPGAFETIRRAIEEVGEGPLLFRALMHPSASRPCGDPLLLWGRRGLITRGRVTGQNLATPNVPGRIGTWVDDFVHMETVINAWGGLVHWREEVIARCY